MIPPNQLIPQTTIFERMSSLAREVGAINLGQGFPDLADPPELIEAAKRALTERSNQYPPMRGLLELRHAIGQWYVAEQQLDTAIDDIIVTSGATEALAASILALIRPGDEVIVFQPLYDAYLPLIERAGGVAKLIDLVPPHWHLPLDVLEAAISPRTRLLVLNTPNNPTGTTIDRATLEAVGALCERHDLLILSDEVWEGMLMDDIQHVSPLAIPSLRERTIKLGSAGKIFSLTGWKVGWTIATPALGNLIAAQHQFLTFTTPPALQWAVTEGLSLSTNWHEAHRGRYARARQRLINGLTDAGYALLPTSGTWFVVIDLVASGLPADDELLAERMIREAGIATIPVSAFYAERPEHGYLRLCYAKQDSTLDEAIERMAGFRRLFA